MKGPEESQEHDTHSSFLRMLGSSQSIISAFLSTSAHSLSPSRHNSLRPNSFRGGVGVDALSPPGMRGHRLRKIHAPRRDAACRGEWVWAEGWAQWAVEKGGSQLSILCTVQRGGPPILLDSPTH